MTKEFQRAIYTRSRLKNKMNNNSKIKNITAYKRQRNLCLSKKKCKIVSKRRITTNKNFWTFINSFLTNKDFYRLTILQLLKKLKLRLAKDSLQKLSMNIMLTLQKKSSGVKPKDISQRDKNQNLLKTIREIVKSYENHHGILQTKISAHLHFILV